MEERRWNSIPVCPHCGSTKVSPWREDRPGYYRCNNCKKRKEFCVKFGTIFKKSKIGLDKWLIVLYLMDTMPKGISSVQLSKWIKVSQPTALYMQTRIRKVMGKEEYRYLLEDLVEMDETNLGGKNKNKHADKKIKNARGSVGKTIVFGMVERLGRLRMIFVPNKTTKTLRKIIEQNVKIGSMLYTDDGVWYSKIEEPGYSRESVNHSAKQYVDGEVYTNTIESAWALFKRGFYGTFHHLSVTHVQKYLDEFSFRWSERNCGYSTTESIDRLLAGCLGMPIPCKAMAA